jgi:putative heme-binding domain-containing protein
MRRGRGFPGMATARVCLIVALMSVGDAPAAAVDEKTRILLEALNRLEGVDLDANAALKGAVLKALKSVRGEPEFVELVKKFELKGQTEGLLEVAGKRPDEAAGVQAIRMVLASNELQAIAPILTGEDLKLGVAMARALGNSGDQRAVDLLLPVVTNATWDVGLRKQAVRSVARMQSGAAAIIRLTRAEKLPSDLRFTASSTLNLVRWPEIRQAAAELWPAPLGRDATPLPPVSELLTMRGDIARGGIVFQRQEAACSQCHLISDKGKDFGPALSEIGSKLGKDAIYEAILDPSSGISFDYEAWEIETKSGDEFYGIVVNETAAEVTIKDAQAIPTKIAVKDIARRRKATSSIMPAGLQMTMSTQDLVDLVEYLASLRVKKSSN